MTLEEKCNHKLMTIDRNTYRCVNCDYETKNPLKEYEPVSYFQTKGISLYAQIGGKENGKTRMEK